MYNPKIIARTGVSGSLGTRFFAILLFALISNIASLKSESALAQVPDLSAYRGKVVYLDFWASWCGPCRQSFPWMNDLAAKDSADGLVVVGVNLDHDRDLADAFLRQHRHNFVIAFDPGGTLAINYQVKAMPTAVIIGRDGKIRSTHSGFFENQENQYLAEIRSALDEKASKPMRYPPEIRRHCARVLMFAAVALSLAGCDTVVGPQPWERDLMAQRRMQMDPYPLQTAADAHTYFSKEGSSGGRGFAGGGCGCN